MFGVVTNRKFGVKLASVAIVPNARYKNCTMPPRLMRVEYDRCVNEHGADGAWRTLALKHHPDKGGSVEDMQMLNEWRAETQQQQEREAEKQRMHEENQENWDFVRETQDFLRRHKEEEKALKAALAAKAKAAEEAKRARRRQRDRERRQRQAEESAAVAAAPSSSTSEAVAAAIPAPPPTHTLPVATPSVDSASACAVPPPPPDGPPIAPQGETEAKAEEEKKKDEAAEAPPDAAPAEEEADAPLAVTAPAEEGEEKAPPLPVAPEKETEAPEAAPRATAAFAEVSPPRKRSARKRAASTAPGRSARRRTGQPSLFQRMVRAYLECKPRRVSTAGHPGKPLATQTVYRYAQALLRTFERQVAHLSSPEDVWGAIDAFDANPANEVAKHRNHYQLGSAIVSLRHARACLDVHA